MNVTAATPLPGGEVHVAHWQIVLQKLLKCPAA
jgi:hypothetical protein